MSVIKPRTATVDIYQGDYLDRLSRLEARYDDAVRAEKRAGAPLRNSEVPESQRIADEHSALKAEADADKVVVTVGALTRKGWRELIAQHPPRPDNDEDAAMSVNEDTLREALVPISVVSPELDAEDYEAMSDVDYDRIYLTAWALNRGNPISPKVLSSPASQESTTSGAS
jgi:hypothetical protein